MIPCPICFLDEAPVSHTRHQVVMTGANTWLDNGPTATTWALDKALVRNFMLANAQVLSRLIVRRASTVALLSTEYCTVPLRHETRNICIDQRRPASRGTPVETAVLCFFLFLRSVILITPHRRCPSPPTFPLAGKFSLR